MRSTATGSTVLALLLGLATAPAQAADVVGVAFVHGTGAQTNATQDYWQPTIIDTVRQACPTAAITWSSTAISPSTCGNRKRPAAWPTS